MKWVRDKGNHLNNIWRQLNTQKKLQTKFVVCEIGISLMKGKKSKFFFIVIEIQILSDSEVILCCAFMKIIIRGWKSDRIKRKNQKDLYYHKIKKVLKVVGQSWSHKQFKLRMKKNKLFSWHLIENKGENGCVWWCFFDLFISLVAAVWVFTFSYHWIIFADLLPYVCV